MQKCNVDIKRRRKCHSMRSSGTLFCECGGNSQNEEVQKHSICGTQQLSNQHMLPSCHPQEGDGVAKVTAKREQYNFVQYCRLATISDVSDSKTDTKIGSTIQQQYTVLFNILNTRTRCFPTDTFGRTPRWHPHPMQNDENIFEEVSLWKPKPTFRLQNGNCLIL